jgi:hypothetical protein
MDKESRHFTTDVDQAKLELFASHRLDILLEQAAAAFDGCGSEYQLAALACLLKASSFISAGAAPDDEVLCSDKLVDRSVDLLIKLLSDEGWSFQEVLNILAYMIVLMASNLYKWNKDDL